MKSVCLQLEPIALTPATWNRVMQVISNHLKLSVDDTPLMTMIMLKTDEYWFAR